MGIWREAVNFFEKEWKPGFRVGNYIVKSLLGKGSYGTAYLVTDKSNGSLAVLKRQRTYKRLIDHNGKLLNREADVLKHLDGVHFPRLISTGKHKNVPYFVMEYFEGRTFAQLIFEEGKTFNEKESLLIVQEVMKLVRIIHAKGIVHRDLRIPNILDSGGKMKIIDFGLAANIASNDTAMLKHRDYMRVKSVRADYYALGHFLLFLLYSSYNSGGKKEKSWEEELGVSAHTKVILRRLLQIEKPFENSSLLMNSLENAIQKAKQ
jgi:serine/threonine protein kinase, bacterial